MGEFKVFKVLSRLHIVFFFVFWTLEEGLINFSGYLVALMSDHFYHLSAVYVPISGGMKPDIGIRGEGGRRRC